MNNKRIGFIGDKNTLIGLQIAGICGTKDANFIRLIADDDVTSENLKNIYNELIGSEEIGLLFVCDFASAHLKQMIESRPSVVVIPSRNQPPENIN